MADTRLLDAMEHFAQAIALLAQAGTPADGVVSFIPAAFDATEAAKYIGIGRTKLFEYRDSGAIKTVDVGGRPKYLRKDLDKLLTRLEKG
jgi:hypothetical protein